MSKYYSRKIVIVAEKKPVIDCFVAGLQALGVANVKVCKKLAEAIEHLQSKSVDMLIVDDGIREMNPFEFVARTRLNKQVVSRLVPVILISDNGMPKTVLRAIKAGVDDVMVKPVSERQVRDRIKKTLDNPRDCIAVPSGYVGPDRRRAIKDVMADADRRLQARALVVPRSKQPKVRAS